VSRSLVFPTKVDQAVRSSGMTRARFAEGAKISTSTLLKARAQDPRRGKIHWTSLVMIGFQLGIFHPGEIIDENDPRLRKLAPRRIQSSHGRGAHRYAEVGESSSTRHLRAVS